jgi:hypothetical protein
MAVFRFQPRWKEELVCTAPRRNPRAGTPDGILSAYLPTEEEWKRRAPEWARGLWQELKSELEEWCQSKDAQFIIDPKAIVY